MIFLGCDVFRFLWVVLAPGSYLPCSAGGSAPAPRTTRLSSTWTWGPAGRSMFSLTLAVSRTPTRDSDIGSDDGSPTVRFITTPL